MKSVLTVLIAMAMSMAVAQDPAEQALPAEMNQLAFMQGSWTCTGAGMGADGSQQKMTGRAEGAMKMGNRWLTLMTQDNLEGYGEIWGEFSASYDANTKKWVGTWRDSMSPLILMLKGEMKGNKIMMASDPVELEGMGKVAFEVLYDKKSDDEFVLTVSMVAGGQKIPAMTNTYKRSK